MLDISNPLSIANEFFGRNPYAAECRLNWSFFLAKGRSTEALPLIIQFQMFILSLCFLYFTTNNNNKETIRLEVKSLAITSYIAKNTWQIFANIVTIQIKARTITHCRNGKGMGTCRYLLFAFNTLAFKWKIRSLKY